MSTTKHRLTRPLPPQSDGVLWGSWSIEGGELVRKVTQPSEDPILERNRELRKNPAALHSLDSMGLELTIPELHYWRLVKKYPELGAPDAATKTRAWRRFMGSSESDPYRVKDRRRARGVSNQT